MATKYDPTTADPGQIEKIPADQVIIDPNVRKDIRHDPSFVSSIRVLGFQQHPVGYRDTDTGQVHITVGQRRISAALEIGWPVIPIVIKPRRAAEADRAEELRLLEQIAENEQRAPLTPAELAGGYKQLALLGVTDDQIARKTNTAKTTVQTALAVAASDVATAALQSRPITLEQAAYLVEFEDQPAAVETLTETLQDRPEQIDHAVARLRRDRACQIAVDELTTRLEAAGWKVQHSRVPYGIEPPKGSALIGSLYRADDKTQNRLDVDLASKYTGRIAVVFPRPNYDTPAGAEYFIQGYQKQGLEKVSYTSGGGGRALTDQEKEQRRQKRTDKSEMITATDVRRTWLKAFLARKKLPDMTPWIAHAVLESSTVIPHSRRPDKARELAYTLLDLPIPVDKHGQPNNVARAEHINTHPTHAHLLVAAYTLALAEDILGDPKHAWAGLQWHELAPYLEQLNAWGYPLADVEQRLVDKNRAKLARRVKQTTKDAA